MNCINHIAVNLLGVTLSPKGASLGVNCTLGCTLLDEDGSRGVSRFVTSYIYSRGYAVSCWLCPSGQQKAGSEERWWKGFFSNLFSQPRNKPNISSYKCEGFISFKIMTKCVSVSGCKTNCYTVIFCAPENRCLHWPQHCHMSQMTQTSSVQRRVRGKPLFRFVPYSSSVRRKTVPLTFFKRYKKCKHEDKSPKNSQALSKHLIFGWNHPSIWSKKTPNSWSNNNSETSLTLKCWHPPCLLVLFQKEIHLPAIQPQKLLGTGGV